MKCKYIYIYGVQRSQHMQLSVFIEKSDAKNNFLADLTTAFLIQALGNVYSQEIHGLGGSTLYHRDGF